MGDGRRLTRRGFLLGGGAALGLATAGVATGWLPGRDAVERVVDRLPAGVPDVSPGRSVSGAFTSSAMRGARTGWTVSYPPGADRPGLRVLIALHGRSGNHRDAFGRSLHLDRFQAAAAEHGGIPFAIASVDGGDHSYWHPRRETNAAAMVVDDFIPLLAAHGLDVNRIGLLGWSMGGYGALYLSTVLGSDRIAVAVAESPAIWQHADQSAAGAFDDAADFDTHSIFGHTSRLRGIPLRIDCGSSDGFAPATRELRSELHPVPAGGIESGGHDDTYWRRQAAAQLAFVGAHLNR